jgi:competence protein ComFA
MVLRGYVYALELQGVWRWYVTVSLAADRLWWKERGVERLWVRDRVHMSLGQAFEYVARLKEKEPAVGDREDGTWVSLTSGEMAVMGASVCWDEGKYRRLVKLLEGRCLLREEMESFLVYHGLAMEVEDWLFYVQWGALDGKLRLRHGVERVNERGEGRLNKRLGSGWFVRLCGSGSGRNRAHYRCVRCGSGGEKLHWTACPHCGTECPYCEACLTMGRVRYCGLLVQGLGESEEIRVAAGLPESLEHVPVPDSNNRWKLSPAQADAAREALAFLRKSSAANAASNGGSDTFLLWAVTGAGKTEMMYPLIEDELSRGGQVLLATPRKDVVLELEPRIKAAFPAERVVTLYGGSAERWERGSITLATTHQLFRFREAFDLVVVDEIDAFPFHGDEQLAHAAKSACRPSGKYVFLSATPPKILRDQARSGKLPHAKVCVRFHRHPLPLPQYMRVPPIKRIVAGRRKSGQGSHPGPLPAALFTALGRSLDRGAQIFLFVPHIDSIPALVSIIRSAYPNMTVEGTYSKDKGRTEKVERFRGKELRIIVTTTILERGVTVPKTDVFILDADSPLFDDASLIQMAGRAGRKLEDPQGNVYFCAPEWTRPQRDAVRQIRAMNRLAQKKGYLVS